MIRTLALVALALPAFANPSAEGDRARPTPESPAASPPPLVVAQRDAVAAVGPTWQTVDVRRLCGVEAPGARVRIEEIIGQDARAAADVALDGPMALRLRASQGAHRLQIELSATDTRGNQAFDRCRITVR